MSKYNFRGLTSKLEESLEARVVEIISGSSPNHVVQPDIEDDQKRWLIVGICLHSVISPALRQYIPTVVSKLYTALKRTDQIDTQTYAKHLKRYKPTNQKLNYEAINNNRAIPKVNGKKDKQKYNYNVTSDVDLTRLFMITSMAHYTGFDDTCDSSALLGIIVNIDTFPALPKQTARKVRSDVRNHWAHCNFSDWDVIKYQNSFQLMHQLIRNLQLPVQDQTAILGKLTHWQTNGLQFLQGTVLGIELVKELRTQTKAISEYLLDVVDKTGDSFKEVHNSILDMETAIDKSINSIQCIENSVTDANNEVEKVVLDMNTQKIKTESLESLQRLQDTEIKDINKTLLGNQSELSKAVSDIESTRQKLKLVEKEQQYNTSNSNKTNIEIQETKAEVEKLKSKVQHDHSDLGSRIEENRNEMLGIKAEVNKSRNEIEEIKRDKSSTTQIGKPFFYPPDRIPVFVGREYELRELEQDLSSGIPGYQMKVICGLGGTGKTTLSIEFAWNSQSYFPGGIFWMSAESNEALENSLQQLAIDTDTRGKDGKETMYRTLKWMSLLQERWLLVIDNVDMEEIRGNVKELILGSWKRNSKGLIVITSRREAVDVEEEFHIKSNDCITLDVLSEKESTEFMKTRSAVQVDRSDQESFVSLVAELGGLPLALEQAAAHIKALKCTFKQYLDKFKQIRLKFLRASRSSFILSKERQAVMKTWQLNFDYIAKQSEDEGLGTSAVSVMEITAFLYADEIPFEILNVGLPEVDDKDLAENLRDKASVKQVVEILTRFSLFQRYDENTLNIHRLVQEVVRANLLDQNHKSMILQCATRMINSALEYSSTPNDVVKDYNFGKASLKVWSKVALHANSLKTHVLEFAKSSQEHETICLNIETSKLLHASAIYHSLFQRQDEALASQDQMLTIISAIEVSDATLKYLTSIKIPLLRKDRQRLLNSMTNVIDSPVLSYKEDDSCMLLDPDALRQKGNEAYRLSKYQCAVKYYSEAIKESEENVDPKLLCNRSLAYYQLHDYEKALMDADQCIKKYPNTWKAYCWKAYAIAMLIRLGQLPESWRSVGLAAASVAAHLNVQCSYEPRMKIEYPVVYYKHIENPLQFKRELLSLKNAQNTTLLLRKGRYEYTPELITDVQIIGVENGVEMYTDGIFLFSGAFLAHFYDKPTVNLMFENICFPSTSGQVLIGTNINAIFYECTFLNGKKGCKDFPLCKGGKGCVNIDRSKCKELSKLEENRNCKAPVGVEGYAGIVATGGGKAYLEKCHLDSCGGGGTLSQKEGSELQLRNSTVQNMIQMGVEVRDGGYTYVENCHILNNQFHGVTIGPRGKGVVRNCIIQGNGEEGIWCGGILETGEDSFQRDTNAEGGSTCVITDNMICQNGMSGISLDGGSFDVSGNRIFDNWLWGIMAKSRSTTNICNNDIFENKCGGIQIGINYSASVVLDGNSIRDHSGPALHIIKAPEVISSQPLHQKSVLFGFAKFDGMIDDEVTMYSIPPVMTTRNLLKDNDKGQQHPRNLLDLVQTCCCCHFMSDNLKKCAKCKKACYCSRQCQRNHWPRHKQVCKWLRENFIVEIHLSQTEMVPHTHRFGTEKQLDKTCNEKFIVKINSGADYSRYDQNRKMTLYDKTRSINIMFRNSSIYHLVVECGVLAAKKITAKEVLCWASFKRNGQILCIYTDKLPHLNQW